MAQARSYLSSTVYDGTTSVNISKSPTVTTTTTNFDAAGKIFTGVIIAGVFRPCAQVESSSDLAAFVADVIDSIDEADMGIFTISQISFNAATASTDTILSNLEAQILSGGTDSDSLPAHFALVFEDVAGDTLMLDAILLRYVLPKNWISDPTTLAAQQGRTLLEL